MLANFIELKTKNLENVRVFYRKISMYELAYKTNCKVKANIYFLSY
jgi:hypothetical protein